MKTKRNLTILLLVIALLAGNFSTVFALPPLPSSFYGTVKLNGANVPVGTIISAHINGVSYASMAAIMDGGNTVYFFDVPGDDPATPNVIEGGVQGDTVVFHIGNMIADQTAPWQTGTNVAKNLTAHKLYTLTITAAYGTVKKNPNKASYTYGEVVQLTAVPNTGWGFAGWSGNLSGKANPAAITMDGNKSVTAMFSQITTNLMYGVHTKGISDSQFFTIDQNTNKTTALGTLKTGFDIESLDIQPVSRILYGSAGAQNTRGKQGYLFKVNKQTGVMTAIGYTGYSSVPGLSFRSTGALWGWAAGKGLIQINLTTGKGTLKFSSSLSVGDIAWNKNGTILYVVTTNKRLYGYDPVNKKITLISGIMPSNVRSLDMRPDGLLMMGVYNSNILRGYDPVKKQFNSSQFIKTLYTDVEGVAFP